MAEWLGHVVVCPEIEATDAVVHRPRRHRQRSPSRLERSQVAPCPSGSIGFRERAIGRPRSGDGPSLRAARRTGNARSTHLATRCTQTLLSCRRPARVVREFGHCPTDSQSAHHQKAQARWWLAGKRQSDFGKATGSRRFSSGSSELSKAAGQIWTRGLERVTVDLWNSR
jgi:hypothetical protein